MNRLLRVFVPNRIDALTLFISLLLLGLFLAWQGSVLFPKVQRQQLFTDDFLVMCFLVIGSVAFFCIGVALGWKRVSFPRSSIVLTATTAACLGCFLILRYAVDPMMDLSFWAWGAVDSSPRLTESATWNFYSMLGWFPICFLLGFVVIWLLQFSRKRIPMVLQFATLDRQKFLVGLAVCLFVAAMASKATGAFSVTSGQTSGTTIPIVLLSILMIAAQIGIVVVVPSWILLVNRNWKWKLAFLLVGCFGLGVAIWQLIILFASSRRPQDCYPILWGIMSVVCMVIIYVAVGKQPVTDPSTAEIESDSRHSKRRPIIFPSIWGWMLLALTCGFLALPGLLEPTLVLANPLEANNWVLARKAKTTLQPSGSRLLQPVFQGRMQQMNYWKLSGSDDQDVLESFDELNNGLHAVIDNLQPHVDTSSMAGVPKSVSFVNCQMSYSQLNDILDGANGYLYFQDVELVGETDSKKIVSPGLVGLSVYSETPGAIGKIFEALSDNRMQYIQVMTKVHQADIAGLQQIAGKNSQIRLHGEIDWNINPATNGFSLNNVSAYQQTKTLDELTDLIQSPLFRQSNIRVTCYNLDITQQQYWDLFFLMDGRVSIPSREIGEAVDQCKDFLDASKKYHWGFGYHPTGELKDLLLPGGDSYFDIAKEKQIETLSFDSSWVTGVSEGVGYGFTDLSHLSSMSTLKRLYLSNYTLPESLAFLANLGNLEHLQIRSPEIPLQDNSGFHVCNSLESLTLFGKPDPISVQELSGLKQLKNLCIVDWLNEEMDDPKFKSAVKKLLPNVELNIVTYEQHLKQVPESFRKHQNELKPKLKQKLFKSAE